ncbi:hypothetical protein V0242_09175 [Aeromonas hydrophila]|uniref:hypothetical protein n=1 Tax=Aeromonas hydrophila TaxID=644 RepID=UPI002ED2EE18|nr:hypothetical protein V0242_09175 [Aeromonas hydrophila]
MQTLSSTDNAVLNMYNCLLNHPEVKSRLAHGEEVNLLIGFDESHYKIAKDIYKSTPAECVFFRKRIVSLNHLDSSLLISEIEKCDIFIFLYQSSTLASISSNGPSFLKPIKKTMQENWKKSILFKDYGVHFYEAFSEPRENIAARNSSIIDIAVKSKTISFIQDEKHHITTSISSSQKWTSIDGGGNLDITPREIATHIDTIDGKLMFSGTFLSTIPFAIKYGVVSNLFTLNIEKSVITCFSCKNKMFSHDFDKYLSENPSNSKIEEFGIGTNCGVSRLYGINAGFEERHPGLHLGLGGGAIGSHHLDLIFEGGDIFFDKNRVVHANKFVLKC